MILIKNTQRTVPINSSKIEKDAQKILRILGYDDFDVGIWFCSDTTIKKYNRDYRKKDKVTDILSFAYHSQLKPGKKIKPKTPEDKNLGDLIIAPTYVKKDLPRWDQSFAQRMQALLVHGICHLLGYDHIKDADYKIMKKEEDRILKKLT